MDTELKIPRQSGVNWKKTAVYILPLAVIGGLFFAKIGGKKGRSEAEYVQATQAFSKWEQVLDEDVQELAHVEAVLRKHPELNAHYDARIGQNLLSLKDVDGAKPYIERTLERVDTPYYSIFAKTSLLISEEKYEKALEVSLQLRDAMVSDSSLWEGDKDHSALFAFNLLRIATLYKEAFNASKELEAWKELKAYGGWDAESSTSNPKISRQGFEALLRHFSVQNISLLDYIASREESLKQAGQ